MRRQQRSEQITAERAGQIRAAARRVFAERGYAAATTDEIARAAGVSPGLVFHYFPSKKALLVETMRALAEESLTRSLTVTPGESLDEQISRFVRQHGQFMTANLDLIKVVFYEAQFHEEVRELVVNRLLAQGTGVLETFFRRQQAAGAVRSDLDIQLVTRSFVGMLWSLVMFRGALQEPVLHERDPAELYGHLVRVFLDGVRAPQQAGTEAVSDGLT